ncbi:UDP-N-acetyl glucosamine 2-epimerase [Acrocarpospora phusangensis]|uniref:UDP-N-acetylglucosamine 2-epimerase (non-hydrolyzing) n=1 Tax=Acrocarpospora phusangensis TaxID=1070424 RepID=A0A919Q9M4_9ACTN|nr:UDP-N-acetylglucosamine 2-epimerase (non-hydrolyzing) [Acrocarpospora phusangensis]GIH23265.1 UDP-N-acetyl glucosamine 2-epimerase [Acrocarpospora phusangensis]
MRKRVAAVVGTRPEAIKLGVVVEALHAEPWAEVAVVGTGQHGAVVDDVLALFGAAVDRRVALGAPDGLTGLASGLLGGLGAEFAAHRPDLVLVQGDTTSALAGALAAYLAGVPVAHVEAGLRSYDALPFPEEANRRMIAPLAALHLAPTPRAAENLLAERIPAEQVVVTGNTVIDALFRMGGGTPRERPLVVVTAHRRESWGEPLRRVARVVTRLARTYPDIDLLVATHMNPAVREIFEQETYGLPTIECAPPMPYQQFVRTLTTASLVITDSGGVQEEAASLRLPLLIMRETTERGEALHSASTHLVGTDEELIFKSAAAVLDVARPGRTARTPRPCVFGDGKAADRTVRACGWLLGMRERPAEFHPME